MYIFSIDIEYFIRKKLSQLATNGFGLGEGGDFYK
jgi:hypothetical protein